MVEPGAGPEGFRTFCHRLNHGPPTFGERVRREPAIGTSTAEAKELRQQTGDFRRWRSAILDFSGKKTNERPAL